MQYQKQAVTFDAPERLGNMIYVLFAKLATRSDSNFTNRRILI